jgi:hypothetical protein
MRLVVAGWKLELVDHLPIRRFIDLPMNSRPDCPLKIRGQALRPGSTGVMIFLHFRLLHFFLKLSIVNYQLSIIHYPLFSRPHLLIGAPDLHRERAVRQKTSCLSRRKAASYLSFSEQAAIGSMRRCSLDFFCILFCIKAKKYVGFGATPQESMDN